MRATEKRRPKLVYVLGQFPSISETFILREMRALEEMGYHLIPLSIDPAAEGPVHADAEVFLSRTLYRPRPLSAASLGASIKALAQHPFGFVSALLFVLRNAAMHPGYARELVAAFLAACWFSGRLDRRAARHVHAHFASYPATVGLLLAELCSSSFSISCHAQDIFGDSTILLSRKLQEADFVTVCTRYGLERLQRNHSLTSSDKLHLIHHGIEAGKLSQQRHVGYRVPMIVSVGRLVEKKGFPFLLQAAAILSGQGQQFELVIVGDGPMRDELERLAGGLGLRDKVVFTGHLSQEDLSQVYRRADAFCLASIVAADGDRDGLPNVILEAMAYGVPVVASNLSAIPEAVEHEETGLLAPPGTPQELAVQLDRALNDEALRARLIEQARIRVADQFDLLKNTVRLGALFAEALGLRRWPPTPSAADEDEPRVKL